MIINCQKMQSDTSPIEPTSPTRKMKADDEKIEVKPSTELIPDEYVHSKNESVAFYLFRGPDTIDQDVQVDLLETMRNIGLRTDLSTIKDLNGKEQFENDLNSIQNEVKDKSALLLIFIGQYTKDHDSSILMEETGKSYEISLIWNRFTSNNCPHLKDKPKILIFCMTQHQPTIQSDSARRYSLEKVYGVPTESDILIVYKKIDKNLNIQQDFIGNFCGNVRKYGKKFDIIDLITCNETDNPNIDAMIISTLTRRFYMTVSTEREHYLSAIENNETLESTLAKIKKDIEKSLKNKNQKKRPIRNTQSETSTPTTRKQASGQSTKGTLTDGRDKKAPWR